MSLFSNSTASPRRRRLTRKTLQEAAIYLEKGEARKKAFRAAAAAVAEEEAEEEEEVMCCHPG